MLTYLTRNTRPGIEYTVHQCARFKCNARKHHDSAIKRIFRYIIGTNDTGLIFKPTGDLSECECYVDAYFAGNYNKENCEDHIILNPEQGV